MTLVWRPKGGGPETELVRWPATAGEWVWVSISKPVGAGPGTIELMADPTTGAAVRVRECVVSEPAN
jgi:hypothetical protein